MLVPGCETARNRRERLAAVTSEPCTSAVTPSFVMVVDWPASSVLVLVELLELVVVDCCSR